jgi:hypothetical protein
LFCLAASRFGFRGGGIGGFSGGFGGLGGGVRGFSGGFAGFSGGIRGLGGGTGLRAFPALPVGYIETGTLKDNAAAAVNKPAQFFTALGTTGKGLITHALENIKRISAAFTFIFIGRHENFLFYLSWISYPKSRLRVVSLGKNLI